MKIPSGGTILCYCENVCPPPYTSQQNGTCIAKAGAQCYSALEEIFNSDTRRIESIRSFGCLPPDERSLMQCKANLIPHTLKKAISCCNYTDFCNKDLWPMYKTVRQIPTQPVVSPLDIFLISTLVLFLGIIGSIVTYLSCFKNKKGGSCQLLTDPLLTKAKPCVASAKIFAESGGFTSGSGAGQLALEEATAGKKLKFEECIYKGRFCEISKAMFVDGKVAVKKFSTVHEDHWKWEYKFMETHLLNHRNVLQKKFSDKIDRDGQTLHIIVTPYQANGSLRDYLGRNVLDEDSVLKLATTLVDGLQYLHDGIPSKEKGVAHRDIDSTNILVNLEKECVIWDYGNAVDAETWADADKQIPNMRYAAPEVLTNTVSDGIEYLQYADVYSMALVFWEICRRCKHLDATGKEISPNEKVYELPYDSELAMFYGDCILEDEREKMQLAIMRDIVCSKGKRPPILDSWSLSPVLKTLSDTMKECWLRTPTARPKVFKVRNNVRSVRRV